MIKKEMRFEVLLSLHLFSSNSNISHTNIHSICSMRGFLVGRMSSSLVLLRATDTPFYAEQSTARMQNNSLTSALSLVSAGLTKIQTMMEESKTAANNIAPTSTSRSGTSGAANSLDQ